MKVRELQISPVISTEPSESIAGAADEMRFYEVGSLAVLEHGKMVAIITERDLVRAMADRVDPERVSVRRYMTADPITISADADAHDAASMMLANGVRHLPVVEGEQLVGMVSVRDLLPLETAK